MKRRKRNRRRNKTTRLDFHRLEARQLLAGDVIGPHQVGGMLPTGANIVVNGDFESVVEGEDRFFKNEEVAGWNAIDAETGQELNIFHWNVDGFKSVLDLDSTATAFDRVYQDVATESGTEYLVSFDYRNHPIADPDASPLTHDFEVTWNGEIIATLTGGNTWNTSVLKVTASEFETTRLIFSEIQEDGFDGGDGRGALLDNVRIVRADLFEFDNGGFEKTGLADQIFFRSDEVAGWTAVASDIEKRFLQIVESDGSVDGIGNYLNLDTTADHRDIVSTELATEAGASYYLTFDMRNDGEQTINPDELRIRWNNQWAGTIFATNEWETYGLLLTADSDLTELMFLEPGETMGTGSGPLITNVQTFMVVPQTLSVDINGEADGVDGESVYAPGAGAIPVSENIALSNPISQNLTSAIIKLNDATDGSDETLVISSDSIPNNGTDGAKIVVTAYDPTSGTLVLTGSATVAEYQSVLRTLTYFNGADVVSTNNRTIDITIMDSGLSAGISTASAAIELSIETAQTAIDSAIITKFIEDNSLNAQNLGNGLYAVIDTPGSGLNPTVNSSVRVKYDGKFIRLNEQNKLVEGESFDASSDFGVTFGLTQVIQGWTLGIPAFKTGGSGKLIIPSDLAYGPSGTQSGSIPPNTVLVFDVLLLEIVS